MISTEIAAYILANMSGSQNVPVDEWKSRMGKLVKLIQGLDQIEIAYGPGEVFHVEKDGVRYYKLNDLGINQSRSCSWFVKVRNEQMVIGPGETNDALYISMAGITEIVGHVRFKDIRKKLQSAIKESAGFTDAEISALTVCGHAVPEMRMKVLELFLVGITASRLTPLRAY